MDWFISRHKRSVNPSYYFLGIEGTKGRISIGFFWFEIVIIWGHTKTARSK